MSKQCPTCGGDIGDDAIWCKHCQLYQLDAQNRTFKCNHCGTYVPAGAGRCYKCSGRFGPLGRIDVSVTSVSALTALLASGVALLSTAFGLLGGAWKAEAEPKFIVRDFDGTATKINIAATNDGEKAAMIASFQLKFPIRDDDGNELAALVEPLYVAADHSAGMVIRGGDMVETWLQPRSSGEHWNLSKRLRRDKPDLTEDDAQGQEQRLLKAIRKTPPDCEVLYSAFVADRKSSPVSMGSLRECHAFILEGYGAMQ